MSNIGAIAGALGGVIDMFRFDPVRRRDRLVRRRGRLVLRLVSNTLSEKRRERVRLRIITLNERISKLDEQIRGKP
jgi:hypothetical protein